MGLFCERQSPSPDLVNLMSEALQAERPPPGEVQQRSVQLAGRLHPLTQAFGAALNTPPPANPDAVATANAQALVNQLLGGAKFNSGRFVIATTMFLALVGGGIATEATHLATASGTLFGFAGAIFGIVTAFLGSEKGAPDLVV